MGVSVQPLILIPFDSLKSKFMGGVWGTISWFRRNWEEYGIRRIKCLENGLGDDKQENIVLYINPNFLY